MSIWFYICNFRLNLDEQKAPNDKHSHVWGKKRQKRQRFHKRYDKKKMYKPNVHQFEKLLCLFSDIKQFWPLKKQFKRGTSHVAKKRLGYLGTL